MIFITHCLAIILCNSFKALTSTTPSAGGNNRIAQLEEENRELKKGIIVIVIQTLQEEMKVFMAGPPPSPSNFCIHLYFLSKERYCKRD